MVCVTLLKNNEHICTHTLNCIGCNDNHQTKQAIKF